MNTLKSLVAAVVLMFALAVSTAGQDPLCKPGETQTPPCSSAQVTPDDLAAVPGETSSPEVQGLGIGSLVELALYALLLA